MRRASFLGLAAAASIAPVAARAQSDADPAITSSTPALRVLLGPGDAQPSPDSGVFLFNGRPYRGEFTRIDGGAIVNLVDIEQYLYAVVSREMSPGWPAEALQAQAVCARTYVLARSNPRRQYDLVPSELDQVYAGIAGESAAGRGAVDATAGQLLRFGNFYAQIAYSSCCGGHTEASSDAWGSTPVPYLSGVRCTYCTASPNYRWNARLELSDLELRLADRLQPYGALHDVRVAGIDASGRARAFQLLAQRGSFTIKGSTFRMTVGPRLLKSLLIGDISLDAASGTLDVEGAGLGHGVGLCQWGARGMALAGHSARDILALYFPGTQVSNA